MKKTLKNTTINRLQTLEKDAQSARQEIATMSLNSKVNPSKDTNSISKKKKLAVLLTALIQKKMKGK